jgi:hypothetical protein
MQRPRAAQDFARQQKDADPRRFWRSKASCAVIAVETRRMTADD